MFGLSSLTKKLVKSMKKLVNNFHLENNLNKKYFLLELNLALLEIVLSPLVTLHVFISLSAFS